MTNFTYMVLLVDKSNWKFVVEIILVFLKRERKNANGMIWRLISDIYIDLSVMTFFFYLTDRCFCKYSCLFFFIHLNDSDFHKLRIRMRARFVKVFSLIPSDGEVFFSNWKKCWSSWTTFLCQVERGSLQMGSAVGS